MEGVKVTRGSLVVWLFGIIGLVLMLLPELGSYLLLPKKIEAVNQDVMANVTADELVRNKERLEAENEPIVFAEVTNIPAFAHEPVFHQDAVVGALYVPSVSIELPILYGATNDNLSAAAATMKKGQEMGEGNYALAGHNAKNPSLLFAPIRRIEQGDLMYLTDKRSIYVYIMTSRQIVMPERVDVIQEHERKKELTLVSCYKWDGSDRIIVTGELTQVIPYDEAPEDVVHVFEAM